jgi:hypothetical protein
MNNPLETLKGQWQTSYSHVPFETFLAKYHEKYYGHAKFSDFTDKLGLTTPPEPIKEEPTPYPPIEGAYGDDPSTNIPRSAGYGETIAAIPGNIGRSAVRAAVGAFDPSTYEAISRTARGGFGISPEEKPYASAAYQEVKQSLLHPLNTFANDPVGTGMLAYGGYQGAKGLLRGGAKLGKEGIESFKNIDVTFDQQIADTVRKTFEKAIRPPTSGKGTYTRTEKYYKDAQGSVESIINNKKNLSLTDPTTGEAITGKLPTTLAQHADAIEQTKTAIFHKYDDLAKTAEMTGRGVNTSSLVDELRSFAGSKQALASGADKYALKLAKRYERMDNLTLTDTQNIIADLNRKLKAYDRTPNPGQVSNAGVDALARNNLRRKAEDAIGGSGYTDIKRQYGELLSAEKEINQRALVDARKNIKGFFDLTDVYTAKELIVGVLKHDPARLAGAAAMNATKSYIKYMNSPNRMIANMFEKVEGLMGKRPPPMKALPPSRPPAKPKSSMTDKMDYGGGESPYVGEVVSASEAPGGYEASWREAAGRDFVGREARQGGQYPEIPKPPKPGIPVELDPAGWMSKTGYGFLYGSRKVLTKKKK